MNETDLAHHLAELRQDRAHGAAELARLCLGWLAAAADAERTPGDGRALRTRLSVAAEALAQARPGMAPIAVLLGRWRTAIAALDAVDPGFAAVAARLARDLAAETARAAAAAADRLAVRLAGVHVVMTHSLSSTVMALYERLAQEPVATVRAIVTESRPLCEGHAAARRLAGRGIAVTLITDAQIALFVGAADAVVVGADAVWPDGSVVNKVGTHPLALAARAAGVPFYVCCESFKRWPDDALPPPPDEEMAASELGAPDIPGVVVRNRYFERTPADLIDAVVTERD